MFKVIIKVIFNWGEEEERHQTCPSHCEQGAPEQQGKRHAEDEETEVSEEPTDHVSEQIAGLDPGSDILIVLAGNTVEDIGEEHYFTDRADGIGHLREGERERR